MNKQGEWRMQRLSMHLSNLDACTAIKPGWPPMPLTDTELQAPKNNHWQTGKRGPTESPSRTCAHKERTTVQRAWSHAHGWWDQMLHGQRTTVIRLGKAPVILPVLGTSGAHVPVEGLQTRV